MIAETIRYALIAAGALGVAWGVYSLFFSRRSHLTLIVIAKPLSEAQVAAINRICQTSAAPNLNPGK